MCAKRVANSKCLKTRRKEVSGNAIKLGVRGFVRICIETCARGCFGAWKYRFRKKGHADK